MSKVAHTADSVQAAGLLIRLAGGREDDKWSSASQKTLSILKTDGLQLDEHATDI